MSYRNPQIIVDRSAEIWAQGVSKIGETIATGITKYGEAKKIAAEKQKKIKEAENRFLVNTELQQDKDILKIVSGVKDTRVRAELTKIFQEKGGAAMNASAELGINTNLSKKQRQKYRKAISDFQSYMVNSKDQMNNISTGAQDFNDLTIDQVVNGHAPASGDEISNLTAVMAINGKKTPGVENTINIAPDENNSNILTVNSRIKVGSDTYNKFKEADLLGDYKESDGYVNIKFERDLSKWNGSFFEPIPAESDRNKTLQESNIFNDKNQLTKDFVYPNITTRKVGGFEYKEQVVNNAAIEDNVAYMDLIKSHAKGIMSYPMKQQKQFIMGRLKWDKETAVMYESMPEVLRETFLVGQMVHKNLESLGTKRLATPEDVKNLGIPNLKVNDPIYTKNIGRPTIVQPQSPKKTSKLTEGDYRRLNYKDKVEYLDSRFTTENITFESAFELANGEGIKAEKQYKENEDDPHQIKVGSITINKTDSPAVIKKKLLIAGGVKARDAANLIKAKETSDDKEEKYTFNPITGGFDKQYSAGEGVLRNE